MDQVVREPPPATAAPAAAAPVAPSERLLAIDATRGLAILGILLVNIQSFAEPFGEFMDPRPESDDPLTRIAFYFVRIFCEGKFYPLFSMLFGMGLVLQMRSVTARRGETTFRWLYARRLLVLMIVGLLHALLVWYGDILFVYAFAGFFLLLGSRLAPRRLLIVGVSLIFFAALIGSLVAGLTAPGNHKAATAPTQPAQAAPEPPAGPSPSPAPTKELTGLDRAAQTSPFFRLMQAYRDGELQGGPEQRLFRELEQRAYHDGPWLESFLFRLWTWVMYLVFCLLGFGWHVIGMFYVGAALLKLGLLDAAHRPLRRKLTLIGALVGLPGVTAGTVVLSMAPPGGPGFLLTMLATMTQFLCGPLISIMYLCVISLMTDAGIARALTRTLAAVGRMALTNYLTASLVCTFVFYHYGLAQFGEWTRPDRIALVFAIFAAQCLISRLWLSGFRFGPMEWIWRTLTYLRPQPMFRTANPPPIPAH